MDWKCCSHFIVKKNGMIKTETDRNLITGFLFFMSEMRHNVAAKRSKSMLENSVVRARIDADTKAEASAVLASIGLTLSDAVRLMLKRVVAEKALPFEPLVPSAETIEAIKAARRGELKTTGSVKNLFEELNADDQVYQPL